MKCDCSLKHQNGGVCTCTLGYTDLFSSNFPDVVSDEEETETDVDPFDDEEKPFGSITSKWDDLLH